MSIVETSPVNLENDVPEICNEIRRLARNRVVNLKSRIMLENRLKMGIATGLGYTSMMEEDKRETAFTEAGKHIKGVLDGTIQSEFSGLIKSSMDGIQGFDDLVDVLDKSMIKLAKQLPVAKWVLEPQQAGFGLKSLAVVIGETGDLSNYPLPGKMWRRMGVAPYESASNDGKILMGATWKSGREGKLTKEEWEDFGYSPRRRSVAYVIGENLIKQNKSIYRARYDYAKSHAMKTHPDWTRCSKCDGKGKINGKKCGNCKGTGEVKMRCHLHGMLLATKLLFKNLWIEWNGDIAIENHWEKTR